MSFEIFWSTIGRYNAGFIFISQGSEKSDLCQLVLFSKDERGDKHRQEAESMLWITVNHGSRVKSCSDGNSTEHTVNRID